VINEAQIDLAAEPSVRGRPTRWIVLGVVTLWTLATNAVLFGPPRGDSLDYRRISMPAPSLPLEDIGSAYTDRFLPHYVIGSASAYFGFPLSFLYSLAICAVALSLLVVLHELVAGLPILQYTLIMGLLVPSPYFLRPYLADAGSVQDPIFVLGTAIALLALVRVRPTWLFAGLLLAVTGRQSALLVGPVAGLWVVFHPRWRARGRWRLALAAAVAMVAPLAFLVLRALAAPFTHDFQPHIPDDTVLARFGDLPRSAPDLIAHATRTMVPVVVLVCVLLAALIVRRRRTGPDRFTVWGALLMAAIIFLEPLAIDPAFPGFAFNEQRLAALCLVPLAYGVAGALQPLVQRRGRKVAPVLGRVSELMR